MNLRATAHAALRVAGPPPRDCPQNPCRPDGRPVLDRLAKPDRGARQAPDSTGGHLKNQNTMIPSNIHFIDLGLPSGKLWAANNATLDDKVHFTFDEAVKAFGNNMPTTDDFVELTLKCKKKWNNKRNGYTYTGPNGNSIFLPATGLLGPYAQYWSRTTYGEHSASTFYFEPCAFNPQYINNRSCRFCVRLVK